MSNESLGDMCLHYICEKLLVPEKDKPKNKVTAKRKEDLHKNKFIRTADVMTGLLNIKAKRQLAHYNYL